MPAIIFCILFACVAFLALACIFYHRLRSLIGTKLPEKISQAKKRGNLNPLLFPVSVTILLIVVLHAGYQINLIRLDPELWKNCMMVLRGFSGSHRFELSILCLGVAPYVVTYLFVEIFSLFFGPLAKLRKSGYEGRRKLKKTALAITPVVATIYAVYIVRSFSFMETPTGAKALTITSIYQYAFLVLVLVAGVFASLAVCELISKYGIGHGISVLWFSGICSRLYKDFRGYYKTLADTDTISYLLPIIIVMVLAIPTVFLLKSRSTEKLKRAKGDGPDVNFCFNLCPSSREPATLAGLFVFLPVSMNSFLGLNLSFLRGFVLGTLAYETILSLCIFAISYVLAWLFFHPKRRLKDLQTRGWELARLQPAKNRHLMKKLFLYNLPWTLLLCTFSTVSHVLVFTLQVPFRIGATLLPVVIAIALDLEDRIEFTVKGGYRAIKVAEIHDVYDAATIREYLRSAGISCHLQGYYHRHMLFFLGPYIEISLFVLPEHKEASIEFIEKYDSRLLLNHEDVKNHR